MQSKERPLCQEVVTPPCQFPKTKRSTKWCVWHWLKRQPATIQSEFARARLYRAEKAEGFERRDRVPKEEWPEGYRWCSGCQTFVPLIYVGPGASRCRACASMAAHELRVTDQYGLRPGEYESILQSQGRRCAICRARPISIRLATDHDHLLNIVRGLLCSKCNHELLGAAHDSLPILVRAVAYLLAPPAVDAARWAAKVDEVANLLGVEMASVAEPEESPFSMASGRGWRGPSRTQARSPF